MDAADFEARLVAAHFASPAPLNPRPSLSSVPFPVSPSLLPSTLSSPDAPSAMFSTLAAVVLLAVSTVQAIQVTYPAETSPKQGNQFKSDDTWTSTGPQVSRAPSGGGAGERRDRPACSSRPPSFPFHGSALSHAHASRLTAPQVGVRRVGPLQLRAAPRQPGEPALAASAPHGVVFLFVSVGLVLTLAPFILVLCRTRPCCRPRSSSR